MAVSSIPNATHGQPANSPENQQKLGSSTEQSGQKRSNLASDQNSSGTRYSDNVSFSQQVGKTGSNSAVSETNTVTSSLDAKSAEELLQRTIETYMADSKMAVSTQAKVSPEAGRTLLADT